MKIYRKSSSDLIEINMSKYLFNLKEKIMKYQDFEEEEISRLSTFSLDKNKIIGAFSSRGFNTSELEQAIDSKDREKIHKVIMEIFEWVKREKISYGDIREGIRLLNDYDEVIGGLNRRWTDEFCNSEINRIYGLTLQNMEVIKSKIQGVVNSERWSGSKVIIEPNLQKEEIGEEQSATISVVSSDQIFLPASFSYFASENEVEIDDILEAGDLDFFEDNNIQSDYFLLIDAIRNKDRKAKVLSLYTARPKKDREYYLNNKSLPSNVFLTSSFDFAEGFAREYGGEKDVWKVRISNEFLVETMGGQQKQYQAISKSGKVPLESIELIVRWEDLG